MKKYYLTLAFLVSVASMTAQSFEYSLSFLGTNDAGTNYEVALIATPNFTETNGNSADMGTVISMSTNVFAGVFVNDCINSGPPTFEIICEYPIEKEEWAANYLSGPSGVSGRTVYSFERTETGESTFFDATSGTPITLAVFEINNTVAGLPSTGDISLVENGDTMLDGTPNGSYFNIKYTTATSNITTDLYGAQDTSANTINFSTLSTPDAELSGVSIYPNPVKDIVTINGLKQNATKIELYNIAGQNVLTVTDNLETIDVSSLQSGVYFTKIYTDRVSTTIKLIKE